MSSAHTLFIVAAIALAGCESAQDKAREADQARAAADQKVAQVNQTTQLKELEVQQKANDDISRIARDGEKKVIAAEMGADRKADDATQALWQARDQARADSSRKLDGLNQDVATLRPKLEQKLPSATAATVEADLQAKAAAVRKSILDLDQCTADNLDAVKKTIHTRFDDLEQALADAKKRV